jgi:hypothetical protein
MSLFLNNLNNNDQYSLSGQVQNNNNTITQEFIVLCKKGKLEDVEYFFNTIQK